MDSKPEETSIASNTPEQGQGDVLMIEPKKLMVNDTKLSIIDNILTESSNLSSTKSHLCGATDDKFLTDLKIDIKNSPIKDETENCSQQSLIIGENSILSPPKSEPTAITAQIATEEDAVDDETSPLSQNECQPLSPVDESGLAISKTITDAKESLPKDQIIPQLSTILNKTLTSSSSSSTTTTTATTRTSLTSIKKEEKLSTLSSPVRLVINGVTPKSGKPLMAAINKKLNKPRGRPKSKSKTIVPMYQSEISNNTVGIKLCIKKSDQTPQTKSIKPSRKRSRKSKQKNLVTDSDDSDYEKRKRKEKSNNNRQSDKNNKKSTSNRIPTEKEPIEQSPWANQMPSNVLYKIFKNVVQLEGCLPTLFRLGRVCSNWRDVSLSPSLWSNIDLSAWVKEKHRTELRLKWLIDNRLKGCKELNMSTWKVSDVQCVLNKLLISCPDLVGISLTGWKDFYSDHLMFLSEEFKKLQRIDLSSINIEVNPNKSAVGIPSLCKSIQTINGRLTHLHLADNRLAGIPQIISTLAAHCPKLLLLDLSNVRTFAISHGILHIEKLQKGCPKLKVLRITNSHIVLNTATLAEQMESEGFPELEELSVASLANESRLLNDEFLQRILKNSTKLKLLDVRGCARLTHDSLIRLQAWDLKHLFLSGCSITRDFGSGLELIASKWAHSLIEFDLAWANVQAPLDNAIRVLSEKGADSPLTHLNLCGSSISEEAVKEVLANCPMLNSINLSSCRGLPRGVKRLMHGPTELQELRDVLKVTLRTTSKLNTTKSSSSVGPQSSTSPPSNQKTEKE